MLNFVCSGGSGSSRVLEAQRLRLLGLWGGAAQVRPQPEIEGSKYPAFEASEPKYYTWYDLGNFKPRHSSGGLCNAGSKKHLLC